MIFTVVIPLFNKAPYIDTTISSVLNQEFLDFEVVVVDDGSSDAGPDLIEKRGDPRIRLIRQPNGGVSAARNHGIEHARGAWIAFLDADDWWHPGYLAAQFASISQFPDAHVVATGFVSRRDSEDWRPTPWALASPSPPRTLEDDLPRRFMKELPFFTGSVAVNTALLRTMQPCFAPGETVGEDLDLWFRLGEMGPVVLCAAPLVAYRDAAGESLSSKHRFDALPPYLQRMQARASSGRLTFRQVHSAMGFVRHQRINFARKALGAGQRIQAFKWLSRAGLPALKEKRWWVIFFMASLVPTTWVSLWQRFRWRRALQRQAQGSFPYANESDGH
ncbi:glycosyltransferase family 2 protein [Xylophilus sp. GOD-11R]|uniref:glycosyltransferase family 2 protein n=1 Tax=Xylophilus sp. GOD-11R TaxID=3089814 RepID=UPI00298D21BC|nr:glycosyltransferase family 2 protein [Xylophilus sp. GOD-11R]WPB56552.1 glycosyltransferase family 2 protein [Xylophilus sp. GOD-11R]